MSDWLKDESESATGRYRMHKRAIELLLDELKAKLETHARRAAANPTNHGFAGDLAYVEGQLRELGKFLG